MRSLAPAKLNLHLRIARPRADGFHPLLTWMTTIGLFDSLTFCEGEPGEITMTCDEPGVPCDDRNLVMKAAKLLAQGTDHSVIIQLEKNIPHGGGLGGGSSDAAFTLLGLRRFWKMDIPPEGLDKVAAKLGSDINFFLHGPSNICTSRGEIVKPITAPAVAKWALLWLPNLVMPTPAVFRRFDEMKLGSDITVEPDWNQWAALSSHDLLPLLANDLETPAFTIEPSLGELRQRLERTIGRPVRMSGSGSSLFTLFDEPGEAQHLAGQLGDQHRVRAMAVELCPRTS
jgi:4-diphosphocytidyl-2-C-methyl-D-erythritol kinase